MNNKLITKLLKCSFFVLTLCLIQQANAEQVKEILLQDKKGVAMSSNENSKTIIENFYRYFNNAELEKMVSLFSEDITHEINHGGIKRGKEEVFKHLKYSGEHYKEQVSDFVYMISDDGRYITVKFTVNGKYLKTDESNIPATGQNYVLDVFNYFEIKNDKIVDAKCFYDEAALMNQYKKQA